MISYVYSYSKLEIFYKNVAIKISYTFLLVVWERIDSYSVQKFLKIGGCSV